MDKFVIKKPKLDDSVCLGKRKGTFINKHYVLLAYTGKMYLTLLLDAGLQG
jgi:hypothetical protein